MMTIEQKAKAYDEASKIAKEWYNDPQIGIGFKANLEKLFHQLKKSEYEKIRKNCIHFLELQKTHHASTIEIDECIAWLEKQGEQNPTDKVEPKFHEGDWVIDKQGIVYQVANVVENVTNHTYGYDIVGGGYFNDNNEGVRLWSIEDAKPGDVLATDNGRPFIFKGCLDEIHPNNPVAYCGIDCDNNFYVANGIDWWTDENVYPATKEQRDKFEKAMADAGYTFDFDKKKLSKIKNRPLLSDFFNTEYERGKAAIDWSEDDEKMFEYALDMIEWYSGKNEDKARLVSDWFKSLKQRLGK